MLRCESCDITTLCNEHATDFRFRQFSEGAWTLVFRKQRTQSRVVFEIKLPARNDEMNFGFGA